MGSILTTKIGEPDAEVWKFLIMPFMSGLVGYGTNWLALKMTFYPLEFFGIELLRIKDQPLGEEVRKWGGGTSVQTSVCAVFAYFVCVRGDSTTPTAPSKPFH